MCFGIEIGLQITTFPLYNSATYLKTAEFKLRFEDGNEVTRSQFRLGEMRVS